MEVRIRQIKEEDLKSVLEWRNNPVVRESSLSSHEITWSEHLLWWKTIEADDNEHRLIVELNAKMVAVSSFSVVSVSKAEWSYYLVDFNEPIASKVLFYLSMGYAFETLGLKNVNARVLPENKRSANYLKKYGFQLSPDNIPKSVSDCLFYEFSRSAWLEVKKKVYEQIFETNDGV